MASYAVIYLKIGTNGVQLLVNSFVAGFKNDVGKGVKLWPPHNVILPKPVKQSQKQSIATKQKQKA